VLGGILAQAVGIRHTFFASAGVYFIGLLLVIFGYHEPRVRFMTDDEEAATRVTFRALSHVPHFVLLVITVFGLQLVDRSLGPILPLYLPEVGIDPDRVPLMSGILFTVVAAAAAVGNQTSGWLLSKWPAGVIVPLMAAIAAGPALVFGAEAPWMVLLFVALIFGYALGAATTCTYTAATHTLPVSWRGVAFGYLTSAYLVGLAVSPVVAGFIGAASMRAVFVADAIGLAVLAWIVRRGMNRGDAAS
jgi:DHA1 family multidrug resistance protein-like MFS transporter